MNVSKDEIHDLEQWLGSRLGALVAHTDKVRELLQAGDGAQEIIQSAADVVLGTGQGTGQEAPELTPRQVATYKSLLPLLAEHGLLAVRGGGPVPGEDRALNKDEAAQYLGVSVRKLQRHMKKRQIQFEKYGTGQTASVRFRHAELDKFRASREVSARTPRN